MTSLHQEISIVVATVLLVELALVFVAIYRQVSRRPENILFAGVCLLIASVLWSTNMLQKSTDIPRAVFWYRVQLTCAALAVTTSVDFTLCVSRLRLPVTRLRSAQLYGAGVLLCVFPWSPLIVVQPRSVPDFVNMDDYCRGPLFACYTGVLLLGIAFMCFITWSAWFRYRATDKGVLRGQDIGPRQQGEAGWTGTTVAPDAPLGSFGAHMGWLAASITTILVGSTWEFLVALGANLPEPDYVNPRAIGFLMLCIVAARMLAQDVLRTVHERRLMRIENERLADLAQNRLEAVRDTQHEVKNGLTSLRYRLESALTSLPTASAIDTRKHLALGMKQFTAVSLTLDVMLDIARLEAGQPLSLGRQAPTDLPDLVRRVCLRQIAAEQESEEEAGILQTFAQRFRIESRLSAARYYVFAAFLDRVLANLINNAWKYSPANTPIVVCLEESRGQQAGEERLHIRVTDQGIGIDESDLELIFERPFYRTSGATQAPGTGAGLNLCRRYIEAQGGHLRAESDGRGHGSTFHILLPLEVEGTC